MRGTGEPMKASIATVLAALCAMAEAKPAPQFMAHSIWSGALPEKPHGEMLKLATKLVTSHRVPAMKSSQAYVRWVENELGPNLQHDQEDLAKLVKLADGLTGS